MLNGYMLPSLFSETLSSTTNFTFSTVEEAIQDIANGEFVIVVDDPSRENEGDLVIAAECITESKMAFMLQHTTGIVCVPLLPSRSEKLNLPLMVPVKENTDPHRTQWLITVDAKHNITTGVSAHDRTVTAHVLSDPTTTTMDLVRPGHVFPLRYTPGGVLVRPGHTEASVDLCLLAKKTVPVSLISELMHVDGTMMRGHQVHVFAKTHGLRVISIDQLQTFLREKFPDDNDSEGIKKSQWYFT
ncbi:hypothetical protein HMI55_001481 [Coelomomyces lativittatus]|nr:hypothetical protein HMI56_003254 [Coelomomyces lativittatus]KAJ1505714.1 hypothetical protein HMI55_001481 [Coelomomyces lativittatus]